MAKKQKKKVNVLIPSLIDTKGFSPTALMIKTAYVHLKELAESEGEGLTSVPSILEKLGADRSNFYKWQEKEGFSQWWQRVVEDFHTNVGLTNIYNSIYKYALGNSPQDRKLYLERFDKEYKPVTRREQGVEMSANKEQIEAAIKRSQLRAEEHRKQVQSTVKDELNLPADSQSEPEQAEQSDDEDTE